LCDFPESVFPLFRSISLKHPSGFPPTQKASPCDAWEANISLSCRSRLIAQLISEPRRANRQILRSLCDFRQTCSGLPYSLWALAGCSGRPGYLVWLVRHWVPQKPRWLSHNLSWYAIPGRGSTPPSWAASHQTMRSRLHCLAHAPLVAPLAWPITGRLVPTSHVMQGSLAAESRLTGTHAT
jgi:hypothetical protein